MQSLWDWRVRTPELVGNTKNPLPPFERAATFQRRQRTGADVFPAPEHGFASWLRAGLRRERRRGLDFGRRLSRPGIEVARQRSNVSAADARFRHGPHLHK